MNQIEIKREQAELERKRHETLKLENEALVDSQQAIAEERVRQRLKEQVRDATFYTYLCSPTIKYNPSLSSKTQKS